MRRNINKTIIESCDALMKCQEEVSALGIYMKGLVQWHIVREQGKTTWLQKEKN